MPVLAACVSEEEALLLAEELATGRPQVEVVRRLVAVVAVAAV